MDHKWLLTGASSIGASHISSNSECQDSFRFELLNNGWGIAVVSDGAGSAKNSKLGSEFVVKTSIFEFSNVIQNSDNQKNIFEDEKKWEIGSIELLKNVSNQLKSYSESQSLEYKSLACTLIIIVFNSDRIYMVHIGDGRACYCSSDAIWKPLLTPYKGEFVNETVFLTSDFWQETVEVKIIEEEISAFALMSDGCEMHSFECNVLDENNNFHDPNKPFDRFFNPVVNSLKTMYNSGKSSKEIDYEWETYLKSGPGFVHESDDKTMVVGIKL